MSTSAYFSVKLKDSGRDISGLLDYLEFEGNVDKDNVLIIKSSKEHTKALVEDPDLVTGSRLVVQWGTSEQGTSKVREVEVVDIKTDYGASVKVTITAFDYGNALRKNKPERKFENMTASDIVKQIAKDHKLKARVDATKKVYEEINQSKRSDYEVISELANKEEFGQYIFYVDSDTLYFVKRDLNKPPFRKFEYGTVGVIGLVVNNKQTEVSSAKNEVQTITVDPKTKKVVTKSSSNGTETKLGKVINKRDADGNLIGSYREAVPVPAMPAAQQQAMADKVNNDALLETMEASLQIAPDPKMEENELVEITGVAKKHQGNWYVSAVRHTIAGGSTYTVKVTLKKNATAAPASTATAKADQVNNKQGKNSNKKKKVVRRDANGNRLN